MRAPTSTTLLDDVWQALEELEGTDQRASDTGPGWITAVSTRGSQLRILLRLPAEQCRGEAGREGASALADVADVLRTLPALTDVELEVRPHRASADLAATTGACWHELPAAADLLEQRHQGWFVEGAQHRGVDSSSAGAGDTTVRVLVRARIAGGSATPRDAA